MNAQVHERSCRAIHGYVGVRCANADMGQNGKEGHGKACFMMDSTHMKTASSAASAAC